ncbi:hypothetical protein [Streptomyces sp. HPF1205]|uniref:hypothetical protein n=1 Tax=Streptomyces sp. HPF1205 TaxID=2873262 RepID=UPI001CED00F9|nr:hypothetical protein [Streptomyces sp. HPF1205]
MTTPTKRTTGKAGKAPGKRTPRGKAPATKASTTKARATKAPSGAKASSASKASTASDTKAPDTKARARRAGGGGHAHLHPPHPHDVTITLPVERATEAAKKAVAVPVVTAQKVLPAKGGLPLYLGLGALGVAGVLEWPVAVGIGVGYAVLRRGGAVGPADGAADGHSGRAAK